MSSSDSACHETSETRPGGLGWQEVPFAPRRWPFFYGWWVAVVGTAGMIASFPGQTIGVAPFRSALESATGLDSAALATAYMIGTLGSGFALGYAARLYDRWGARVLGAGSACLLGLVLAGLSVCDYSARAVARVVPGLGPWWVALAVLSGGFFALRFAGQGVLTLASRNMVAEWFERRRGLVIGLSSMAIGVGHPLILPLTNQLIGRLGWRETYLLLAVAVGGAFAGVALVFYRTRPEDCGLLPDGASEETSGGSQDLSGRQFTLSEARRTLCFWAFALAMGLFALLMTAYAYYVDKIYAPAGVDRDASYYVFFPASVVGIGGQLVSGYLSDRVRLKWLLTANLAGMAVMSGGMLLLTLGPAPATAWAGTIAAVVGQGVTVGTFGVVSAVVWPRYFGRRHLGAISGQAMSFIVIGSAVGPWLFSLSRTWTGSYAAIELACLVACAALLAAAAWADNPRADGAGGAGPSAT